jgi:2,4-dienoyl-CoA reductase-like NADH-dependent reductase (Old Yellow Enzyme family)
MYDKLRSPMNIGQVNIPNRVVMTAMGVFIAAPGGGVNDDIIAYYEARAKGGVGLITTEVPAAANHASSQRGSLPTFWSFSGWSTRFTSTTRSCLSNSNIRDAKPRHSSSESSRLPLPPLPIPWAAQCRAS